MRNRKPASTGLQLLILTIGRFFLTTGNRIVYPFLPVFARGLGVSLGAMSQLLVIRSLAALIGPIFAPLSERFGRKPMLIGSLFFFAVGCLLAVVFPTYWMFGVALALLSLTKVIYDPVMQAHVGDIVPYANRGRAIAFTEMSWSTALLIGAPLAGFTIARFGWQSPFLWLAIGIFLSIGLTGLFLPNRKGTVGRRVGLRMLLHALVTHPSLWAVALYMLLLMAANDVLLVVYGAWMETSFGLSIGALGLTAVVIGSAELSGEVTVGAISDRFGKRRLVLVSVTLAAILYALLPLAQNNLTMALVGMFVLFLFFEIAVVAFVPIVSELMPETRSVALSVMGVSAALGRALGAFIAPLVANWGGITATGLVAGAITLLAMIVLAVWIRE
jgi:predicted MFS family arabinose efflux permease